MVEDLLVDRAVGCLVGLAVGDALGAAVEFSPRGAFPPVEDMRGGGPFGLPPGAWTDDTSMALCLATSLLERGGFDPKDQMDRYVRWWREGYWSSTGVCFDIGMTTRAALARYEATGEPFAGSADPWSAGNGCLMRLAPVLLYFFPDTKAAVHFGGESARTTHGTVECIAACRLFASILCRALAGKSKDEVLSSPFPELTYPGGSPLPPTVAALAQGAWRKKSEDEIRGSGYVVESLEAALWCFHRSISFEDAVLRAVNLGQDADTTGAVTGQIAGAYYGARAIPPRWRKALHLGDTLEGLARALIAARPRWTVQA